jgi:hyaluronan synthase
MLQVRFMMSFDLLRAGQSVYGTVYCCPGALAAYRMSVIRDVLDDWSRQTFLGVTCTYGEDRALTNFILDRGYDTVYQCSAVVHTVVPTTYARLVRMYLRWERSHLREEIRFARILWKRPVGSRVLALVDGLLMNVRYPLGYLASWLLGALSLRDPAMILRIVLLLGVASLFNLLFYLRTKRPADFLYGVLYSYFSTFTLFWLLPYAALTLRSRSWMTR